jgi:hypothetical protein
MSASPRLAQGPASGLDPAAATQAAGALNTVFFDLVVANLPSSIDVNAYRHVQT